MKIEELNGKYNKKMKETKNKKKHDFLNKEIINMIVIGKRI